MRELAACGGVHAGQLCVFASLFCAQASLFCALPTQPSPWDPAKKETKETPQVCLSIPLGSSGTGEKIALALTEPS